MRFDRTSDSGTDDDQASEASASLSAETTARLVNLCADNQITLNTIFQAAWGVLLSRYSQSSDIIFGATRSCRHSALNGNTDSLMGPIINTLPLRMQINPRQTVMAFLKDLRQKWVDMSPFENTPLAKIVDWSGSLRGQPLFDTICNFSNEDFTTQLQALAPEREHPFSRPSPAIGLRPVLQHRCSPGNFNPTELRQPAIWAKRRRKNAQSDQITAR